MKKLVSEKWKEYISQCVTEYPIKEVVERIEDEVEGLSAYNVRFTADDIAKIQYLAIDNKCTFDDVVQDVLDTIFECRFRIKSIRRELLNNLPKEKLNNDFMAINNASTRKVLLYEKSVNRTCLVGTKRSNESNKEMPIAIRYTDEETREVKNFQFFLGSTIRLGLNNYSLFKHQQKLIKSARKERK